MGEVSMHTGIFALTISDFVRGAVSPNLSGRVAARAADARGTPTQSHVLLNTSTRRQNAFCQVQLPTVCVHGKTKAPWASHPCRQPTSYAAFG